MAVSCGAGVVGLGLLGLVSWYSGVRILSSILSFYIAMAPSTAYSLLLLGGILIYPARTRPSAWGRAVAVVVALLVAAFGLLSFIELFVGIDLNLEDFLFPTAEKFGEVLTNRISPLTGLTLFLGGTNLLIILRRKDQAISRHLAGFLGCSVTIIGAIATLGYIFGTPLLYGGVVVPMALTTGIAFLLMGVGLAAGTGPGALPLRMLVGPSTQARLLRAFLPMTVAVVMVQGLLHRFFPAPFHNYALGAAILALIFSLITGGLVVVVGRTMGRAMDFAQAKRKRAEEALNETNVKLEIMIIEASQRNRETTLINGMLESLVSCLNFDEAYTIIANFAQQLFAAMSGGLFMLDPAGNYLDMVASWGDPLAGEKVFAPINCWAIRHGRIHLSGDSFKEECCRHLPDKAGWCYVCLPLIAQEGAFGLLHLQAPCELDSSAIDQMNNLAVTVGDSISLTLANLKLRETLRQQAIHDPLTGLFNRRYLDETLEREIHRVRRKRALWGSS